MEVGQIVKVKGKSNKGKSRVGQWGTDWVVVRVDESVLCLDGRPGVMLESRGKSESWRWVALENDRDFEIIKENK